MGRQRMQNVQKERSPKISSVAKRGKWYYNDEENIMNFNKQLAALGLELREIPGDGNCLFRALADQLNGHSRNHMKYRQEIVEYMRRHKEDFEPFVEDGEPYEDYLKRLSQPGTYAGNDAIVAFSRRYRLIVVIHQLNSPMWQISGSPFSDAAEVHISYHNGEHYSSVRRIGDESKAPACLTLSLGANQSNLGTNLISADKSRGEPITKGTDFINCKYNEQNSCTGTIKNKSTSDDFKNSEMKEEVGSKSVTLWGPNGTGYRIFGDCLTPKTLYKTETEPLKSSFVNVEDTRECNDKQQNQSKYKEEKENSGSNRCKSQNRSEHSTILVKDLNCLNI